jgi:hypothetical protein
MMAETVIYPLSEETGQRILAALLRIAKALEGNERDTATYANGMLSISGNAYVDEDGYLHTTATEDNGYLTF